jgi:hypothetical protein
MISGIVRNARPIWSLGPAVIVFALLLSATWSYGVESGKILVLPFHVEANPTEKELFTFSNHVNETIKAAINRLGSNFSLVSEPAGGDTPGDGAASAGDEEAHRKGEASGADMVVYGLLASDGNLYRMRAVMWDLRSKRVTVAVDHKVPNIHALPGVLQLFVSGITKRLHGSPRLRFYETMPARPNGRPLTGRFPTLVDLPRTGPWMSGEIEGALWAVDVGDMVGDKKNETVFIEEGGVSISRIERGTMSQLTQYSQSPAKFIGVEVEDLDGDGVAELILCYQTPSGLESAIARYVKRNFEITAKFPNLILRTIPDPEDEKKRILVGQRTDVEDMFTGEMVRFRMEQGRAVPAGNITLPPGTLLLSYASGRLGNQKQPVRIILNQDQRLMVFDTDNRLLATVSDKLYGLDRRIRFKSKNDNKQICLPGRLVIADTDGDGQNELLTIKQSEGGCVIQALSWEDNHLTERWKTVRSRGIISDFKIKDLKNDGVRSLTLILIKPSQFPWINPRSVVYAYDLVP